MRYRDTKTGRYVSKSTWRRSRSHGGTRYRRVSRTGPHVTSKEGLGKKPTMRAAAPPLEGLPPGFEAVVGAIPAEFLEAANDYFEPGYEGDEEDEY